MTALDTIRRVMLVDDDPDIRFVAEIALARVGGWAVDVMASGLAALTALADPDRERPDVVLLDVTMPEMDGPAVIKLLRQLPGLGDLPVIFMTAKIQTHEVAGYLALGALGVIHKPFDAMGLPELVREIVEQ